MKIKRKNFLLAGSNKYSSKNWGKGGSIKGDLTFEKVSVSHSYIIDVFVQLPLDSNEI